MSESGTTTGQRLRLARTQKRMTQPQLAKAVGVSDGIISQWENDKYEPKRENLENISKALEVDIDHILGKGTQREGEHFITSPASTAIIDELQKLSDQAVGILTVVIETRDLEESIQRTLWAVKDIVLRMDTLQSELHYSHIKPKE